MKQSSARFERGLTRLEQLVDGEDFDKHRVECTNQFMDDIALCVADLHKEFGEHVYDYAQWHRSSCRYKTYDEWITKRACIFIKPENLPVVKNFEEWVWSNPRKCSCGNEVPYL